MFKEIYKIIEISKIKVVDYRHQNINNVNALAESIKLNGLLNPITVEYIDDNEFNLIAGYHRLQAHKILGLNKIACNIRTYNKEFSDKEKKLFNVCAKNTENTVRQILSPAQMAQAYLEEENAYKNRFPDYAENPTKYIERFKTKQEALKRAKNLEKSATNKNDKDLYINQIRELQKDLVDIIPPSENLEQLFPNASKKDLESAKKIGECEKNNRGLIRNLINDNINKTTINKVIDTLTLDNNAKEYNYLNEEERKQFINQLAIKSDIKKMDLPVIEKEDGIFEVGELKKHTVVLAQKLFLVPQERYNVKIEVKNNNLFKSIIQTFELPNFKCLVIIHDRKSFYNFIESFK